MNQPPKSDSRVPGFTVRSTPGAVSFEVVVVPRASRSKIAGLHGASLKVTLAAPPVEGEANAELCKLLAKALGVPKRSVQITHGEHSKHKTVQVEGATVEQVLCLSRNDDHEA
jgi:uncharacterized protein (TIGR00251 family)